MSLRFKGQKLKSFCFLILVFLCASCGSIPNLETTECETARNDVREFYSYHFGNEMRNSKENLQKRERFLSENLRQNLNSQPETATDYFTQTENYPKAFRIGTCQEIAPNKTVFSVLLFWKNEEGSEQREIKVEAIKQNEEWLIDKVESN